MASSKQHFLIGAAVGAGLNIIYQLLQSHQDPSRPFDWLQFGACSALGGGIGVLADVVEPATSPNHRAFFHSITFAAGSLYASHGPHTQNWQPAQRTAGKFLCYCYLSHLVADARTPRGLPWI